MIYVVTPFIAKNWENASSFTKKLSVQSLAKTRKILTIFITQIHGYYEFLHFSYSSSIWPDVMEFLGVYHYEMDILKWECLRCVMRDFELEWKINVILYQIYEASVYIIVRITKFVYFSTGWPRMRQKLYKSPPLRNDFIEALKSGFYRFT